MLKQRILTAIPLFLLVIFVILYSSEVAFKMMVMMISLYAAWEWIGLIPLKKLPARLLFVSLLAVFIGFLWYKPEFLIIVASLLCVFYLLPALFFYPKMTKLWAHRGFILILGWVMLAACWLALTQIQMRPLGSSLLLYLLLIVWAADIGAYAVGKWIGRRKLLPRVSPGKSFEGLCGGLFASFLVSLLGGIYFSTLGLSWFNWMMLALSVSLLSVIGDLLISLLKRQQGIKDTGQLLPGHGGLLDRIDSLLTAAPGFVFALTVLV